MYKYSRHFQDLFRLLVRAVSSTKCNELKMRWKTVIGVRHNQFWRILPSEALTRTDIVFTGDGIKLDLSETG